MPHEQRKSAQSLKVPSLQAGLGFGLLALVYKGYSMHAVMCATMPGYFMLSYFFSFFRAED